MRSEPSEALELLELKEAEQDDEDSFHSLRVIDLLHNANPIEKEPQSQSP